MAFPTLFMPSTDMLNGELENDSPSKFTRLGPRYHKLQFFEWCTHLMLGGKGRFCSHPFLKFVLLNIKNREQALSSTTYAVTQMPGLQPLEKTDLQDVS